MCGIFAILNNESFKTDFIKAQFIKGQNRGPEFSKLQKFGFLCLLGFHRLAINGLNDFSNQPIIIGDVALICNGEIYNYKELYKIMGITPTTQSDCEVIIHLYLRYGMKQTLQMLDGVFAFVLSDNNLNNQNAKMYIARDPYGVRPLYELKPQYENNKGLHGYASELKMLSEFYKKLPNSTVKQFTPGTYSKLIMEFKVSPKWELKKENCVYHSTGFFSVMSESDCDTTRAIQKIQHYLYESVKKRVLVTERPIACLLSGGLDSSLITALVNECHKQK